MVNVMRHFIMFLLPLKQHYIHRSYSFWTGVSNVSVYWDTMQTFPKMSQHMTKFTSTHDKQKFNKVEEQRERREKRVVKERKGSVDESEKQSIMCLFFFICVR